MAYLSLNRRWRPRAFGEVTRQEHVTRTLRNAVTQGRVAQAYLFGGRRGTGKTTMARLLAMCLNCGSAPGPTAEPCGKCESCEAISRGSSPDVIELDAASNRGIDEIRALQENVGLSPMAGRFKVYIIDEAHQMTKDAYNAFLKTLEEPPPHVVFILATTEPEKIIPTVRSRCQRFDFRPVPEPDIVERLCRVAVAEGLKVPDELLLLIARKAEGSLRDALGLLEQCVAFAGESPSVDDFLMVTGGLDRDALRKLAGLTAAGQVAEVVEALDAILRAGRDPAAVLGGLIGYLRDVFLAGLGARRASAGALGTAETADAPNVALDGDLVQDAQTWPTARLLQFLDRLIAADSQMRYSPQPRLVLEMALLGFALEATRGPRAADPPALVQSAPPASGAPRTAPQAAPSAAPPSAPSAQAAPPAAPSSAPSAQAAPPAAPSPSPVTPPAAPPSAATAPPPAARPSPPPGPTDGTVTLQWLRDNWEDLLNRVRKKSVFARAFLLRAKPIALSDGWVTLGFGAKFHKEQMEEEKNRQVCEEALSEATGVKLMVRCRLLEEGPGPEQAHAPTPSGAPDEPLLPRAENVPLPPPGKSGGTASTARPRASGGRTDASSGSPRGPGRVSPLAGRNSDPSPGSAGGAGSDRPASDNILDTMVSIFDGRRVDDER